MLDWNDLRYFVAVADQGSTLKAGRALRVSQTTVARRIGALEVAVGLTLFERRSAGYALTPDGESLLGHARQVAGAAAQFETISASRERGLSGSVRLTTQEIFAITLLAPMIKELHDKHPEILLEVDTQQDVLDLGEGQSDIALRSTGQEASAGVVGRRICVDDWTLYCSRGYAAAHGVPHTRAELKGHAIIGGGGGKLWVYYEDWLRSVGLEGQVAMHHASAMGLLSGVRSGLGLAVLPCVVADAEPDLIRCLPSRDDHGRSMWLLTHDRVRSTPRVRLVIDFLYERLMRHVRMLAEAKAAA